MKPKKFTAQIEARQIVGLYTADPAVPSEHQPGCEEKCDPDE